MPDVALGARESADVEAVQPDQLACAAGLHVGAWSGPARAVPGGAA